MCDLRWAILCVAATGLAGGAWAGFAPSALSAPEIATPVLDGALDDPGWAAAAVVDRLYEPGSDTPSEATTVRLGRDGAWLYVGFDCRNPAMGHVRQRVFRRDGPAYTDESVELFLRPDPSKGKRYYHQALSFANVQHDKRITMDGARDESWSAPWRSATRRRPDGWSAELAIPLFIFRPDDLSGCQLNLCRTLIDVELDEAQAPKDERRLSFVLRPGSRGSVHDFANYAALGGLGGFVPGVPFVPRVAAVRATGFRRDAGVLVYGLEIGLEAGSPTAGAVDVSVIEERERAPVPAWSGRVTLEGGSSTNLALAVPASDFRERRVEVRLTAPGRPEDVLAARELEDASALQVLRDAYPTRSYYTSEEAASVRVEFGLAAELLTDLSLAVTSDARPVFESRALEPVLTAVIPLAVLKEGDTVLAVRLLAGESEMASRPVTVRKLPPRPGFEIKADLVKGVLLKDGQPYFPLGIYAHQLQTRLMAGLVDDDEAGLFRLLGEEIGLNFVGRDLPSAHVERFMKTAAAHGLDVLPYVYPDVVSPMSMLKPSAAALAAIPERLRGALDGKGTRALTEADRLPLADRLLIRRALYDDLEPELIATVGALRSYANCLGYYNVDEPNLVNPDDRIAAAEWTWKTVTALDPYRPVWMVYARSIPAGDPWTRWADVIGYDVYPNPHVGGDVYNDPGLGTAYYAWDLRERCRQDHKVMWFVPVAACIAPNKQPIGLSQAHMLCQAYSAILYGARGLMYFSLSALAGEDAWDGLRTVCAQVKALSPALLNGDVPQAIRYDPDEFRPRERVFPMVNAAVFKYPDGPHLLLAANFKAHAVRAEFRVAGLRTAERLFADGAAAGTRPMEAAGGAFAETLEPYGVRAYRLDLGGEPPVVDVQVVMTPVPEQCYPLVDVPAVVSRASRGRNFVPNPCFAQQTNKGIPDYFQPYFILSVDPMAGRPGSSWCVDPSVPWNGRPSLRLFRRPAHEPGPKTRGLIGSAYPPITNAILPITFSFYAKGETPGAHANFLMLDVRSTQHSFPLTTNWTRHTLTFELPPGHGRRMGIRMFVMSASEGIPIWINGLQMESGREATEFQYDSESRAP